MASNSIIVVPNPKGLSVAQPARQRAVFSNRFQELSPRRV
jgi:hypothetical protein